MPEAGAPSSGAPQASSSAWSPFRHTTFAVLWTATLLSNIGGWMHEVGAGWLMTTMTSSPVLVSLVQTAMTLPVFLLALPSGALADILDRRRLLIGAQVAMTLLAAAMGAIVLAGGMTPLALLLFTFAMGIGTALLAPAWQAIVPSLVPRADLAPAIVLNSVGINVSRAIGPALGGAVILGLGVAWPFLINALSYLIVIAALLWWRPPGPPPRVLPAEHILVAIRSGLRYSRASEPLKHTLCRTVLFVVFASAYFALLPLIARVRLSGGADLYGLLVGCIGAGAVLGAILLPRVRVRLGPSRLVAASTVITVVVLTAFALSRETTIAVAASLLAGASWIAALSSFHVSTQMSLPDWVRARGLSIYTAVFFGSVAGGSLLWGQLAAGLGLSGALLVAAGGAFLSLWPASRFKLQSGEALNLSPSSHWPQPIIAGEAAHDQGPVMITVEYQVPPEQAMPFLDALRELAKARRRGGAFGWGIYRDTAEPARYLEYFLEESWLEHLRHHERVTEDDRALQERVASFHVGPSAPRVRHFLAAGGAPHGRSDGILEGLQ
jgi:MFS family permease